MSTPAYPSPRTLLRDPLWPGNGWAKSVKAVVGFGKTLTASLGCVKCPVLGLTNMFAMPCSSQSVGQKFPLSTVKGKPLVQRARPEDLPAADESVEDSAGVSRKMLASAERQLGNPVRIDLVSRIKIRNSATATGIERIYQAAAGSAHVGAGTESQARRVGSDVDRFGICVVEIELNSAAQLFPQADLQSVVAGISDGAPAVHTRGLLVEHIAGAAQRAGRG